MDDRDETERDGGDPAYRFLAGVLVAAAGAILILFVNIVSFGVACLIAGFVVAASSLIELADEMEETDDPDVWMAAGWPVPHDLQPPALRKRAEPPPEPDVDEIERWLWDQ